MAGTGMNALLVVLDSVRADRLGCYGDPRAATPALDALAADSVRFANVVSESTWTLPVSSTILTGLTPREHRMEVSRHLPEAVPTLARVLREAGYATFGASNNPFIGAETGLMGGFDVFAAPRDEGRVARTVQRNVTGPLGLADSGGAAVVQAFREWLRQAPSPWFATLWLNDTHHPYRVPGWPRIQAPGATLSYPRRLKLTDDLRHPRRLAPATGLRSYLEGLYAHAVSYADQLVGQVVDELDRAALRANTLLIVAADHGDMLGERGLMGHGTAAAMYRPLIHVPLIMRAPGLAPTASGALVQLADISYTIAAAAEAGGRLAPTAAERVDLRRAAGGLGRTAAFCEREPLSEARLKRERAKAPRYDFTPHQCEMTSVVADGWKLIERRPGPSELYHLAEDPEETRDLLAAQPHRAEYLRSLITDFHARARPDAAVAGLARDDAEIVDQRLQDLGYL